MRVVIEKLVFGGFGLARTDKGIIFVDQVLPGEEVEVEITSKSGGVSHASPKKIIKASEYRREPACSHYNLCGGCNWQHINYEQQVEYKKAIFIDCLDRIGKISDIPEIEIFSSPEWEYRQRVQIKVDREKGNLGFFQRQTNEVVPITKCPLLDSSINKIFDEADEVLKSLPNDTNEIKVISGNNKLTSSPVIPEITNDQIKLKIGHMNYVVSGGSFCQGNRFLMEKMGLWVKKNVEGDFFVDMFGGLGFFAIMVADKFKRGLLIESNADFVQQAQENFALNYITNVNARAISSENFFRGFSGKFPKVDAVIIDPPRTGLSEKVKIGIKRLAPKNIIYVSCNPSTQARDIKFFLEDNKYAIKKAALFDLYPQTHHLETIVILELV